MTKQIEEITGNIGVWDSGKRTRVEAGATKRQAFVVLRALEALDESTRARVKRPSTFVKA